jgi:hypothetical protein
MPIVGTTRFLPRLCRPAVARQPSRRRPISPLLSRAKLAASSRRAGDGFRVQAQKKEPSAPLISHAGRTGWGLCSLVPPSACPPKTQHCDPAGQQALSQRCQAPPEVRTQPSPSRRPFKLHACGNPAGSHDGRFDQSNTTVALVARTAPLERAVEWSPRESSRTRLSWSSWLSDRSRARHRGTRLGAP